MMQALARFEQHLDRRFSNSSTSVHYSSDVRIFARVYGAVPPRKITAANIDSFVDTQLAAGMRPSTINRRLASLHYFFEFLANEDPEVSWPNPVVNRRHALKLGFHLPRDASDEDVARIFAVMTRTRDKAMFGLMVGAGLRVGEVAALCLPDLKRPSAPGELARLIVKGKGEKERVVWITNSLWGDLNAWLMERPRSDSDQMFLNWRNQPITKNGIQYCFKQHSDAAGITLSCHQLRHTYARRLAENGLPVESLARLLGHELLQTTQRYIDGANPALYAEFAGIMAKLETTLIRDKATVPLPPLFIRNDNPSRSAPESELIALRRRLDSLPSWLAQAADAYLSWRWPTWREQTAFRQGGNFLSVIFRLWKWLEKNRKMDGKRLGEATCRPG